MGSIISRFRNNHNRLICNNLIEHFTQQITDLNIGINIYIGKNKIKKYRYKTQTYPKYYIILNLPYGCTPNFNIINSGSIILNGNEKMALMAFNKFQSISKIYRPISDFYEIINLPLLDNTHIIEQINLLIDKIIILENKS
jgi:hypothetical protein